MKMKILYVCFTLSFLINMALSIHLLKRQPVCEHKHWDDIDRTKDVIPDGKTAILLAKEQLDGKWIAEDYPYVYFVFLMSRVMSGLFSFDTGQKTGFMWMENV